MASFWAKAALVLKSCSILQIKKEMDFFLIFSCAGGQFILFVVYSVNSYI